MILLASGLPKSYIKKYGISKRAWREYRKSKKRTTSRSRGRSLTSRRTGVKMPRRRRYTRKRRRRTQKTIPILPIVGLVGGSMEPIRRAVVGDFEGAAVQFVQASTGINLPDGTFHPEWLSTFWGPIIVGAIGHKFANMLGINRHFAKLPSPLNKLRL